MLNLEQQLAVISNDPRLLIIAGAGTGKTRTIVSKILHAIESKLIAPREILATTFTNKAAHELKVRLYDAIGYTADEITIGTFHSISLDLLQTYGSHIGMNQNVGVLPYDEQVYLVRNILAQHNLKDVKATVILEKIQKYKENQSSMDRIYNDVLDDYLRELQTSKLMDFADLLIHCIDLFEKNKASTIPFLPNYNLICTDEYQDINDLQDKWLQLLLNKNTHLCCVGDPDQAIYGFRGANASHILNFDKKFPNAKTIKLEQNYRSTKPILDAANNLIAQNIHRIPKTINAEGRDTDTEIDVHSASSAQIEAKSIAERIKSIRKLDKNQRIAILVRSRIQIVSIEEELLSHNVSYTISGVIEFLNRAEIKDLMAYLRFLYNPNDSIAFKRMVLSPRRGLGNQTIEKIYHYAKEGGVDFIEACKLTIPSLTKIGQEKLKNFIEFLDEIVRIQHRGLMSLVQFIYVKSGYIDTISVEKRENVSKWIRSLEGLTDLKTYIEKTLWQLESEVSESDVEVMTIHNAKGLEFDYVFLPGWEEGILPHQFSRSMYEIEEERRLAYVALTRAKVKAIISYSSSRTLNGKLRHAIPSRFIRELGLVQPMKVEMKQPGIKVGEVIHHPRFGQGVVEAVGQNFTRVRFIDMSRLVDSRIICSA